MDTSLPEPHVMAIAQAVAHHIFTGSQPSPFPSALSSKEIKQVSFLLTGSRQHKDLDTIVERCSHRHSDVKRKLNLAASMGMLNWTIEFANQGVDPKDMDLSLAINYNHIKVVQFLLSRNAYLDSYHLEKADSHGHDEIFNLLADRVIEDKELLDWTLRGCLSDSHCSRSQILSPLIDRILKDEDNTEWIWNWVMREHPALTEYIECKN